MGWGTVTIGGIPFREELAVEEQGDGRLSLRGQESTPPSELAQVLAAHRNVIGLAGAPAVPVTFTDKAHLSGFYRVDGSKSDLFQFAGGAVVTASWSVELFRLGTERDLQFESRVPTIARLTDHDTVTPSFWHAPPVGFRDYYTGPSVPAATTVRASSDGDVTVYRGLPNGAVPRWTVPAASYLGGSARILLDGIRRAGLDTPAHSAWELSNGIVRVRGAASGAVEVSTWGAGKWRSAKGFDFYAGVDLDTDPEVTVLRNDPEEATVRLTYPVAPGRATVDLGIRRGSRFVSVVMKRHSAAELSIRRTTAEAGTARTGGIRATNADADGNRYVIGSSRDTVHNAAIGTAGVLNTTSADFFLGHEVGAPVKAGDTFDDLLAQHLGTTGETVRGVRR